MSDGPVPKHVIQAENDRLRADVERLTRDRKMTLIQFEETVARLADDKAHFKARAEAAERKLAMAVEELKANRELFAIYEDMDAWDATNATLSALEKNDE